LDPQNFGFLDADPRVNYQEKKTGKKLLLSKLKYGQLNIREIIKYFFIPMVYQVLVLK